MIQFFKNLLFSILLILFFTSINMPHEYYVSITTINYSLKDKELNATLKFIAHDLEKEIENQYRVNLNIGEKQRFIQLDSILNVYISQHFLVEADGNKIDFDYLGSEYNLDESFYIYLTNSCDKEPTQLRMVNSLLTQTFPKQENITYLNLWDTQKTMVFTPELTTYLFKK